MATPVRALLGLAAAALLLSGCSLLEPTRDADGRIVKATVMPSIEATVGDCFSFVDPADLATATVVPCTDDHTHRVIGTGRLTTAQVDEFGGLENAVNVECETVFETAVANTAEGPDPDQIFIVADETGRDADPDVTLYSCIVTDAVTVAGG